MNWLREIFVNVRNVRDARRYRYVREFPQIVFYRPEDRDQGTYTLAKQHQLDAQIDAGISAASTRAES